MAENDTPIFGMKRIVGPLDEYIGKWVVIYNDGRSFAGKTIAIDGEYLVLNPFLGSVRHPDDPKKGLIKALKYENSKVPALGRPIEPTTEEDVRSYAEFSNNQSSQPLYEREKSKD